MDKPLSLHPQPYTQCGTFPHSVELPSQPNATSSLLDPRDDDAAKHPQVFTGYNDGDVRSFGADNAGFGDEESKSSEVGTGERLSPQGCVWEVIGVILCGCFLALGICVAALKNKPEGVWSDRVIQATRIAPSIWPIIFSGVLGNGIRALADWQVERGVPLLSLEQLFGSLTMGGTIITAFRWSMLNISSAALIALWTFNPLGSQASFRGIHLTPRAGSSLGNISTYDAKFSTQLLLSKYAGASTHMEPTIRALYSSTLYDLVSSIQYVEPTNSTTKDIVANLGGDNSAGIQAATDTWGNVRIPSLIYSNEYNPTNPHEWIHMPWDKKVLNYSSLLGDRVEGVDRAFTGNTTFTITSSFQQFNCSPWYHLNTTGSVSSGQRLNDSDADIWLLRNTGSNYQELVTAYPTPMIPRTLFITLRSDNMTATPNVREMVFGSAYTGKSRESGLSTVSITTCALRTSYVDANVTCASKGVLGKALCGVGALRATPLPPEPLGETVLNYSTHASNSFTDLVGLLDDNQKGSGQSSLVEYYLFDPLSAFTTSSGPSLGYVDVGSLDIELFERRFSLMWNTLWKIAWATESATGGKMTAQETIQGEIINILANTTSNVTYSVPATYAIDKPWLITYFISVSVMLTISVFALVLRSRCRAPAILGYVSSLVRDSTYFDDCGIDGKSTEGGAEWSKRLGKLRVMVADVGGEADGPGKIAFAPVGIGKRVVKEGVYL
ncbi:hypothetical protein K491DRAFT_680660 [Lophiostoma macrostomum CBS 122681]|uniref:Uncharacterized protein n=1 Tax=Lophiostoma macrostomum CBS 122681 TaxID=1314788 RepID=A0A6A6T2Y7_9PLEO|nr:hypothetical protein K491DRAFT_680660 [Lophiostoma macrostomum CBS 122681]